MTAPLSSSTRALPRRAFVLGSAGLAAAGIAGCAPDDSGTAPPGPGTASEDLKNILPNYVEHLPVQPDIPSINGTMPVYTQYPASPVVTVPEPPGNGAKITLATPCSSGVPPTLPDNQYYAAMNQALNMDVTVNSFPLAESREKYATMLASPKDVPDWTCIYGSTRPPQFNDAVEACFEDLTPYLAGSAVEKWPNLAGLDTATWQACVFNGKLMALPYPRASIESNVQYYRRDILNELGLMSEPTTADEFFELAQACTDPAANRWGTDHPWRIAPYIFQVPQQWRLDDSGNLVHRYETEEFKAATEFAARMFDAKLVHPDVLAGTGSPATRFIAGNVVLHSTTLYQWRLLIVQAGRDNPNFDMSCFPMFSDDGRTPVYEWQTPAASFNSFIKKGTAPETVEAILGCANYTAAPFGTKEFEMVRFGLPDVHHTYDDNGFPVQTERMVREGSFTWTYSCAPNRPEYEGSLPVYQEEIVDFLQTSSQYIVKDPFFGLSIEIPPELSSIAQPITDFQNDLFAGRATMSEFDGIIDTWRNSGGEQLRELFGQYLDS